jgi:hypothetical protein
MKKYNILVFPCGSEIALELFNSLKYQKDINLIGLSSVSDHGQYVFKNYIDGCPFISENSFIDFIKKTVIDYKIDFIYPCLDLAIEKLKKHESELGCTVISCPYSTTEIFLSKRKTYEYFKKLLRVPDILKKEDINTYPVFSKPEIGSSSRGTVKIENKDDLLYWTKKYPNNMLLEYLPGEEYTVDCFTTKNRKLKFIGPRKRARVSNGISVGTTTFYDLELEKIANIINDNIEINGAWFFQVKKDKNNSYKLLEIASRFAGSSSLNRILGVNFGYLNVINYIYDDIEIINNNINISIDRSLNIKAKLDLNFKSVYVDFDDTLIINDKVNETLIKFLYNCINNKKRIYLITKHKYDVYDTLKNYKINSEIFNSIIKLNQYDLKSNYIVDEKPIFIDDSFSERKEVYNKLKIPVFAPDCIEALL